MELAVQRLFPIPGLSTTGRMLVNGIDRFYTMERAPDDSLRIPAGQYSITLYHSPRFQNLLAQMREKYPSMAGIDVVPRLNSSAIAGRDPIEIHVANKPTDVEGCIGVGLGRLSGGSQITQSQDAIAELYPLIVAAVNSGEGCMLIVSDPAPMMVTDESLGVE